MSVSSRTDLMSAHNRVSCARSCLLRAKRMTPPVSGCAMRLRSMSASCVPAMSRMRGECSDIVLLDDDEARRVIGFIGDGDVRAQPLSVEPVLQRAVKHDERLPAALVRDLACAPCHRHAHPEPDRLAEG